MKKNESSLEFIKAFNYLFYVSKGFGLVCYAYADYYRNKVLVNTILGNIWSIFSLVLFGYVYHHIVAGIYFDGKSLDSGTLTTIIGIFILYMEPVMMATDIIAAIINQRQLIRCIRRLESVDRKLTIENITVGYSSLQLLSIILIVVTFCREGLMILFGYFVFGLNFLQLWLMNVPIFVAVVSKIWFVLIVNNLRKKFDAINCHLDELADSLKATKETAQATAERSSEMIPIDTESMAAPRSDHADDSNNLMPTYLHKEIITRSKPKFMDKIVKRNISVVQPFDGNSKNSKNDRDPKQAFTLNVCPANTTTVDAANEQHKVHDVIIGDKFDQQLTNLCFIHDEICEIASIANNMFSFQILILMTYGFLAITAQLYFVYCSLAGQTIPRLFRSAENIGISSVLIISTAVVCVYVIHVCWQTKNSAEKTGVFMHKLANIVDENHFYEIINHLSLKLLNHRLNFTACGFFDLDMTTIYAITGAITSYLIILIQFNVAAQRSKKIFMANANATLSLKNVTGDSY